MEEIDLDRGGELGIPVNGGKKQNEDKKGSKKLFHRIPIRLRHILRAANRALDNPLSLTY
jgi:hypothetical protein